MDNIWDIEHRLRCVLVNKQLCTKAADIICNLAKERDYHIELFKDVQAECEVLRKRFERTETELHEARQYIKEHF